MQEGKSSIWPGLGWAASIMALVVLILFALYYPFKADPSILFPLATIVVIGSVGNIMGTIAVILQRIEIRRVGRTHRPLWAPWLATPITGVVAFLALIVLLVVWSEVISADDETRLSWDRNVSEFTPLVATNNPMGLTISSSESGEVDGKGIIRMYYGELVSAHGHSVEIIESSYPLKVQGEVTEEEVIFNMPMVFSQKFLTTYLTTQTGDAYVRLGSSDLDRTQLIEMALSLEPSVPPKQDVAFGERLAIAVKGFLDGAL